MREFHIPAGGDFVHALTVGPDGHVWFTAQAHVGRMTTDGTVTVFGPLRFTPFAIAAAPDGNLWFTQLGANRLGRVTPAGRITEFNIPGGNSDGITVGADGNLWFTQPLGNSIASIDPFAPDSVTEYPLASGSPGAATHSGPGGIALGADGNLWFTQSRANQIGRLTPAGVVDEFPLPTPNSFPTRIALGPDGNLWFTETRANQIGRITPQGSITEFPIPAVNGFPRDIAAGPDGGIWFTQPEANQVARLDPRSGTIAEFPIATSNSAPAGIVTGRDGAIWFAQQGGNRIGRLALADAIVARGAGGAGPVDGDGDGVADDADTCPNDPNPEQADRDGDGVGDVCDNCPDHFNPGQTPDMCWAPPQLPDTPSERIAARVRTRVRDHLVAHGRSPFAPARRRLLDAGTTAISDGTLVWPDAGQEASRLAEMPVFDDGINIRPAGPEQFSVRGRAGLPFPVPYFRPTMPDSVLAFDLFPNGNPTEYHAGFAWMDICDNDLIGNGSGPTVCARPAIRSTAAEFGSYRFNGAPAREVRLTIDGTPGLRVLPTANVQIPTRLGIGGAPTQPLTVTNGNVLIEPADGSFRTFTTSRIGPTGASVPFVSRSAKGSVDAPAATGKLNQLMALAAQGHTGTEFVTGANLSAVAPAGWSPASTPADWVFFTVPVNSTTRQERMRVSSEGHLVLAQVAADPSAATLTSGANAQDRVAIYAKGTNLVFAYNVDGTVHYLTIPLDGVTTTWGQSTIPPE